MLGYSFVGGRRRRVRIRRFVVAVIRCDGCTRVVAAGTGIVARCLLRMLRRTIRQRVHQLGDHHATRDESRDQKRDRGDRQKAPRASSLLSFTRHRFESGPAPSGIAYPRCYLTGVLNRIACAHRASSVGVDSSSRCAAPLNQSTPIACAVRLTIATLKNAR